MLWDFFFCRETFSLVVRLFFFCETSFCRETSSFTVSSFFAFLVFFVARIFLLWWGFLFPRETFNFPVRLFISLWDFLFPVRLFISPWDFLLYPWECFSWRLFYPKWKFLVSHKRRIWQPTYLCLVLWAKHFYNLEKE